MAEPGVAFRAVRSGPSRWMLVGELDSAGVSKVEAQLAGWDGDVILDCSGLTFVSAAGLGLLVRTRTACVARGVKWALVEPSRPLMRLLMMTGLDEVFVNGATGSVR